MPQLSAKASLEQALSISRSLGNRWAVVYELYNLGVVHEALGDSEQALRLWNEARVLLHLQHDERHAQDHRDRARGAEHLDEGRQVYHVASPCSM